MADTTVPTAKTGVFKKALTTTSQKVIFTDQVRTLQIVTDGTADVWFSFGATAPTVPATGAVMDGQHIPAAAGREEVQVQIDAVSTGLTVNLIASAACNVTVSKKG